ncbi:hypothetical protein D0962_33960 [Leptolyngbyaceae cyanobacterium CCMR0082]|uniref:Uncharacterized protein n=1 Tax=Adonisia turfae CCMR0082 TaxID=2304604 RepID=A0A6M0SGK2_9CYAN|nr:hypothetical protein [Adonisia turfae CCMR0082]
MLFLSLVGVAVPIATATDQKLNFWGTLSLSLGASGVATSLIEIINVASRKLEVSKRQNEFGILFSYDTERPDLQDYSFVLTSFNVAEQKNKKESVSPNSGESKTSKIYDITLDDLAKAETKAAVKADIIGVSNLSQAFSKLGLNTPTISLDESLSELGLAEIEGREQFFKDQRKSKEKFLSIGLYSNRLTMGLDEFFPKPIVSEEQKKFFSLERSQEQDKSRYTNYTEKQKPADSLDFENVVTSKITQYRFSQDGNYIEENNPTVEWDRILRRIINGSTDWGILAKICDQDVRYIICGAATEAGTEIITEYVSKRWDLIYEGLCEAKAKFSPKKKITFRESDSYTVLFAIPIDKVRQKDIDQVIISHSSINLHA